jgi:hypothetical protein
MERGVFGGGMPRYPQMQRQGIPSPAVSAYPPRRDGGKAFPGFSTILWKTKPPFHPAASHQSHDPRQSRGLEEALEGHDTDNAPKGASNGSANCIADSWRAPEGAFFYALVFLLPVNGSQSVFSFCLPADYCLTTIFPKPEKLWDSRRTKGFHGFCKWVLILWDVPETRMKPGFLL